MQKYIFKCAILGFTAVSSTCYIHYSFADDYFEPSLLESNSNGVTNIDLSHFIKSGAEVAGTFLTGIYINQNFVDNRNVTFDHVGDSIKVFPMFTKAQYIEFGILANMSPEFMNIPDDQVIDDIGAFIPGAFTNYDFGRNRLDISIPYKYVQRNPQGYVSEKLWDNGVNALFLNYAYSGSSTRNDGASSSNPMSYLNLRGGINIGPWRLRNYSTYSNSNHESHWNSINTYLERDIISLKSHLVIGDTSTEGDMFDSFSFRGVAVKSDDSMQPASIRGFAPTVKGVAQSNAQVTIRQNNVIIWQSNVSPGPFEINDLYPTSASGDLSVTIKEADGSTRTFIQPFASVPIMLREGRFKYSVAIGQYNQNDGDRKPHFVQATMIYGLPLSSTVYGGIIASKKYNSFLLGLGKNLGTFGSVSFDATIANAKMDDENYTGGSFRFQYSKELLASGTSFSLAGYRYSTSNYRDFEEASGNYSTGYFYDTSNSGNSLRNRNAKRDRIQLNVNQSLGGFGSLYVTGYQQKYWNMNKKEQSLSLGYSNNYKSISYSFSYNYSKEMSSGSKSQLFSFNIQIPLYFGQPTANSWLNASMSSDEHGNNTSSVGLSGLALEDNALSYSIQEGYNNRGGRFSASVHTDYKASFGQYQLGYNYTRNSRQLNYGASGSFVIHPSGVTFGQSLGDTVAIVQAHDASGIKVQNNTGIKTDIWGNAIVPYVSPFQKNNLMLDTTTLDNNTDLLVDTQTVVPTRGAIIMAQYKTQKGYKIYASLINDNIPFGSQAIVDNNGASVMGIVNDDNKVYLGGVPEEGIINVTWGGGQCSAPYKLIDTSSSVVSISTVCN